MASCDGEFLRELIQRLKFYSQWPLEDFRDQNNNDHRHVIDFEQTSQKEGFIGAPGGDDDLAYLEAWQFEVCPMQIWRAHGFIDDDTFFIVWLDPFHNLYPLAGGN